MKSEFGEHREDVDDMLNDDAKMTNAVDTIAIDVSEDETVARSVLDALLESQKQARYATERVEFLERLEQLASANDWEAVARFVADKGVIGDRSVIDSTRLCYAKDFLARLVQEIAPHCRIVHSSSWKTTFNLSGIDMCFDYKTNGVHLCNAPSSLAKWDIDDALGNLSLDRYDERDLVRRYDILRKKGLIDDSLRFCGDKDSAKETRAWFECTVPIEWSKQSFKRRLNPTLVWKRKPEFDANENDFIRYVKLIGELQDALNDRDPKRERNIGNAKVVASVFAHATELGFDVYVKDERLDDVSVGSVLHHMCLGDDDNVAKAEKKVEQARSIEFVKRYFDAVASDSQSVV